MCKTVLRVCLYIIPVAVALAMLAIPSMSQASKLCPICGRVYGSDSFVYCEKDGAKLKKVVKRGQSKPKKKVIVRKVKAAPKMQAATNERRETAYRNERLPDLDSGTRFVAYSNGTVLDTRTKLMWAPQDNGTSVGWAQAKAYCENYRGGGYTDWRMPTIDELTGLYDTNKTYGTDCGNVHTTASIRLTCTWVWASDILLARNAAFNFNDGIHMWRQPEYDIYWALPVRYAK